MNSLLKKYLFYNLLGLVLLAIATTVLIVVLNNYQLTKRLKEIDNQNLIIYNFLNSSNFFRNNESESIYEAILSKLEIKNLSILILDNEGNVVVDTKGYDVASGNITPSPLIEIEELGKNSNDNEILNFDKKKVKGHKARKKGTPSLVDALCVFMTLMATMVDI